ncbi:MAG: nitrate/nitrite transport system substrate-binding protein [Pseudohongiellaceae bacterium]|jgi:nitrate/nitrite transport system substrate-binding protein
MTAEHALPPAEKVQLKLGYMRLTDAAPLILAKKLGYYEELGLDISLIREVSWANLRDRLVMGDLDAAQLLAPLPMMTSYGAAGIRANILTGLSLSLNGNAITLSNELYSQIHSIAANGLPDPLASSKFLHRLIDKAGSKPTLTFATVHLFSMHTQLLRIWLKAGNVDPDRDVKIIVLPPEQMCDSLARGIIDGYCVGEPWNTLAVQQGIGSVISSGYQIWNNAPEKVLGVTEDWHRLCSGSHLRLRIALMKACEQLTKLEYRMLVAQTLSEKEYLDLPVRTILPSLTGNFCFSKNQEPVQVADFHVFGSYQAGFPWRSHAQLMLKESSRALSKPITKEEVSSLVQQSYRPDLYREAARYLGKSCPSKDFKTEGLHNSNWELEEGVVMGPDKMLFQEGE